MHNTKDEVEIKITKKDRIYLSIILSLVCIITLVAILVPRYYQTLNSNKPDTNASGSQATPPSNPDSETGSNSGNNSEDNSGTNPDNNAGEDNFITTTDFINCYSTKALNKLIDVNSFYNNSFGKFLDSNNILKVDILNIDQTSFSQLEQYATIICEQTDGQNPLIEEYIMLNDVLLNNINYFKNLLNNLKK